MPIDIRPIPMPERLGVPEARPLEAYVAFTNEIAREIWGHDHFEFGVAERLARHRDTRFRRRVELGAYEGDDLVAAASADWENDEHARMAEMSLGVRRDRRRQGIGTALLAAMEQLTADAGRPVLVGWSEHAGVGLHADGEVLRAPDGDATLPADGPAARFAVHHGFELQQLERVSGLSIDGRRDEFTAMLAARSAAAAASGYRLVHWQDRAPDDLVEAYAAARARMVLDVPAGGLEYDDEEWSGARVRAHETERLDSGTGILVAAAVTEAGEVAGYTELELPKGLPIVHQSDTLVVGPHRGHGLGMLVKLANLARLGQRRARSHRGLHVERRRERPTCSRSTSPWDSSSGDSTRAGSDRRPPRHPEALAARTPVRGPVHEGLAHHRRAAARAGQARSPVGVQRVLEVARRAVDVHVLRVEARPALRERLAEHVAHGREQLPRAADRDRRPRLVAVQANGPQRLVGVDVAHAARDRLVEQHALHARGAPTEGRDERVVVERVVERVAADVRDLARDAAVPRPGDAGRVARHGAVERGHHPVDGERAEGALVEEVDAELPMLGMLEVQSNARMPVVARVVGRAQQ